MANITPLNGGMKLPQAWPIIDENVRKVNAEVVAHVDDTKAHAAEHIEIANVVGAGNVAEAFDKQSQRIDNIVSQSGDDITEIVDAREGYGTLREKLDTENAAVMSQLADTDQQISNLVTVKADKTEVNSLANQKADIVYVNEKVQAANLQWKMSFATLVDLQTSYPTGDEYNHVVLTDGYIYTWVNDEWTSTQITANAQNVADNTITTSKTTFAVKSFNIFDKSRITDGKSINPSTGEIIDFPGYVLSDFEPVESATNYKRNQFAVICFFNSSKEFTHGYGGNTTPVSSGGGVYVRIAFLAEYLDTMQLEKGSISTPYKPYGIIEMSKLSVYKENLDPILKKDIDGIQESLITVKAENTPYKPIMPKQIVDFLHPNDTYNIAAGKVVEDVYQRWGNRPHGYKITTNGAVTSYFNVTAANPVPVKGVGAICMWIYIEDITKVDWVHLHLDTSGGASYNWQRHQNNMQYGVKNGWNLMRWRSDAGNIADWIELTRFRVGIVSNSSATVTVGAVFGEKSPKAQLMFVQDGGYETFVDIGMPDLHSRGLPITWALTPAKIGVQANLITESDLESLTQHHLNAFSFHSWDATANNAMTVDQFRTDAVKCIRYLQRKGISARYPHRAAITQNAASAEQANALNDLLEAYPTYTSLNSLEAFPFINPRGYARQMLEVVTQAQIGARFDLMKKTHGLSVTYTHGIGTGLPYDVSRENWDYFISRIDEGLSEGWLEGVTYDMLRARHEEQFGGYGFNHLIDTTKFS